MQFTETEYDLWRVSDFYTVIADADVGDAFETMTMVLFVRHLPVFVLVGQEMLESYKENVSVRAGDMGYGANFEDLEDGAKAVVGTLTGVIALV